MMSARQVLGRLNYPEDWVVASEPPVATLTQIPQIWMRFGVKFQSHFQDSEGLK